MLSGNKKSGTPFYTDFWFWVKVIIFAVFLLFLVYPFSTLVINSFRSTKVEGFSLYNFSRFFQGEEPAGFPPKRLQQLHDPFFRLLLMMAGHVRHFIEKQGKENAHPTLAVFLMRPEHLNNFRDNPDGPRFQAAAGQGRDQHASAGYIALDFRGSQRQGNPV